MTDRNEIQTSDSPRRRQWLPGLIAASLLMWFVLAPSPVEAQSCCAGAGSTSPNCVSCNSASSGFGVCDQVWGGSGGSCGCSWMEYWDEFDVGYGCEDVGSCSFDCRMADGPSALPGLIAPASCSPWRRASVSSPAVIRKARRLAPGPTPTLIVVGAGL
jgi:hypothetical protein